MDETVKKEALFDQDEIDGFVDLILSCDSDESKQQLEEGLLGE